MVLWIFNSTVTVVAVIIRMGIQNVLGKGGGMDILCVDEAAGYNVDFGGSSRYICTLRTP